MSKQFSLLDIYKKLILILKLKKYVIIIILILNIIISLVIAYMQGSKYKATTTFVINDQFGYQDISPGGSYYGENLFELIKSYKITESVLLRPIIINSRKTSLAKYYFDINKLSIKAKLFENAVAGNLNVEQIIELKKLWRELTFFKNLKIGIFDRGQTLPRLEVYNNNELFAKYYSEYLFSEIILQYNMNKEIKKNHYLDNLLISKSTISDELNNSLKNELESEIYRLNKSNSTKSVPNLLYKNDFQNGLGVILTVQSDIIQSILGKKKDVDLIQIIDAPALPLKKEAPPYLKYVLAFTIISFITTVSSYALIMKK